MKGGFPLLIFPRNINKQLREKQKIAGDNKMQLFFTIFILGNFFGFLFLDWVNATFLGGGIWLTIVMLMGLNVTAGVYIFRFFVFDETSKMREFQNAEGDSFAKYMRVRKDVERSITVNEHKIAATEFANGSMAFTIQMKFGSNDDHLAECTKKVLQAMMATAHTYDFETRVVITAEDFVRSQEYSSYSESLNSVKANVLKNALILLSEAALRRHKELCNTSCIYFTVRSTRSYQRVDLEDILKNYLKLFAENTTAFRSIQFLDNEGLFNFFTEFYGIGAIDLSTVQAIELSKELEENYNTVVNLLSMQDTDGNIYRSQVEQMDKIFKLGEKSID